MGDRGARRALCAAAVVLAWVVPGAVTVSVGDTAGETLLRRGGREEEPAKVSVGDWSPMLRPVKAASAGRFECLLKNQPLSGYTTVESEADARELCGQTFQCGRVATNYYRRNPAFQSSPCRPHMGQLQALHRTAPNGETQTRDTVDSLCREIFTLSNCPDPESYDPDGVRGQLFLTGVQCLRSQNVGPGAGAGDVPCECVPFGPTKARNSCEAMKGYTILESGEKGGAPRHFTGVEMEPYIGAQPEMATGSATGGGAGADATGSATGGGADATGSATGVGADATGPAVAAEDGTPGALEQTPVPPEENAAAEQ